jgi:hypothetical protein
MGEGEAMEQRGSIFSLINTATLFAPGYRLLRSNDIMSAVQPS